jgi:hypothetical protein
METGANIVPAGLLRKSAKLRKTPIHCFAKPGVAHPEALAVPYSRFITHIAQNMSLRFVAAPSTDCTSRVELRVRVESGVVILTRRFGMAIQAHLVELERKHKILEDELHEALVHLSTDDLQIAELKRRKLMVKDQIERLKHASDETFH